MISLLGDFSLSLAVLAAAGGLLASVAALRLGSDTARRLASLSLVLVAVLFTVASGALIAALVRSDFRFEYVVGYTERALPLGYKLAAFWAGQEGSLLLWAWVLGAMCVAAIPSLRPFTRQERAMSLGTMLFVCGFFAALMLFAANPFQMIAGTVPPDGRGLNPMLQDPGMIAHPPLLFLGYAGFTIPFAMMVGVLVAGRADNRWLAATRRWLLVSWLFLTAGIVLGAWWAYVELGWGGYWAWDPVENASLLPWLTSTALLHSVMVQQHRGMFKVWNAVLLASSFILCIFGTYLTRSGVIDSVHAFAPSLIGTFFLVFLLLLTAGSAGLFIWRRRLLRPDHELEGFISREGAFLAGNVLLVIMMLTTLIGTMFPLLSSAVGAEAVTVKAPFYNKVVAPMGVLLVAVMALGPVLAFGKSAAAKILRSLLVPGIIAALVTAIVAVLWTMNPWALVCVAVATLGTAAVIVDFLRSAGARRRSTGEPAAVAALRLIDRDHRRYGGQFVHLGMMMLVIGVVGSSLFGLEETLRLRPGESATVGRYDVTFVSLQDVREVNFNAVQATVTVRRGGAFAETLQPQTRFYDTWSEQPNTEVAVRSGWREDLYVSLAGWERGGSIAAIQVRVNPLVLWIWLGGIVMVVGALFAMLPRFLPQARPQVATSAAPAAARGAAVRPALRPLSAKVEDPA